MNIQDLAISAGIPLGLFIFLLIWQYTWKVVALWVAARRKQIAWFVVIALPINTLALLEILYIFLFSKVKMAELDNKKQKKQRKKGKNAN